MILVRCPCLAGEQSRHRQIASLENGIADRRGLYNESLNIDNVQIEVLSASIVAKLFSFGEELLPGYHVAEKTDGDMQQLFG